MSNTLSEIHSMNAKNQRWKLGIKEQLSHRANQAKKLEDIEAAFKRLEQFWQRVQESSGIQLRESSFIEAVGDEKTKVEEAFWKQVNRLCLVAIYNRSDSQKMPQLEEKSKEDASNKIQSYIKDSGDAKYEAQLETLTGDLEHFVYFWKDVYNDSHYKGKPYSAVRKLLSEKIQERQALGIDMDPRKLKVDLQFQAWGTNWLTIIRLNVAAKP